MKQVTPRQTASDKSFYQDVVDGKINESWKGLPWLRELASDEFRNNSKRIGMLAGPFVGNPISINKVKLFAKEYLNAPEVIRMMQRNNKHIHDFNRPLRSRDLILVHLFNEYLSHKHGSRDRLSLQMGAKIAIDVFNGDYQSIDDPQISFDWN